MGESVDAMPGTLSSMKKRTPKSMIYKDKKKEKAVSSRIKMWTQFIDLGPERKVMHNYTSYNKSVLITMMLIYYRL